MGSKYELYTGLINNMGVQIRFRNFVLARRIFIWIKYNIYKIPRYFSIIIYGVLCIVVVCIISTKKTDKNKVIYNLKI